MACLAVWKDNADAAIQTLNLIGTLGFFVGPLIVKPFLENALPYDIDNTGNLSATSGSSKFLDFHDVQLTSTTSAVNGSADDLSFASAASGSKVAQAYVVVALVSLVAGVLMLLFFWIDAKRRNKMKSTRNDIIMNVEASNFAADEISVGKNSQVSNAQLSCKQSTMKIRLLCGLLNFFEAGIEAGYAGLVMTFVVQHLHWSKDDGVYVTSVLQAAAIGSMASAAILSRWVKPQVGQNFYACNYRSVKLFNLKYVRLR